MKRRITPRNFFVAGIYFSWQHPCVTHLYFLFFMASSALQNKCRRKIQTAFHVSVLIPFFFIAPFLLLQSCSVSKQIAKRADTILLRDSIISTGHTGISIYDPSTNAYLYNYNADKYFVPASNTKLFTLYAGMKYLGDSLVGLRYRNTIYPFLDSTAIIEIKPSADPTFLHPYYKTQPVFDFLKRQPTLLINESEYLNKYGSGWSWDDYQESYMPSRSVFPMYGNTIKIEWVDKDSISVSPKYFDKGSKGEGWFENGFSVTRPADKNDFFYLGGPDKNKEVPFETGLETWVKLLEDTLVGQKILDHTYGSDFPYYPNTDYNIIYSQPTDSLLTPMMHRSDNFFAEQTLLMTSNEHLGFMNDEAIIDTLLNKDLQDVPQRPTWVDGSGLSRYNLFTPESFIYILNKMKNEFGLDRLKRILPTGGNGTLKNYYKNDSTFIYAKTGSQGGISSLSGFLITRKNKLLIFSVLTNNFQGKVSAVRRAIEHFITGIREKY